MQFLKRLLMSLGTMLAAAALLAVVAPKSAHALVATLVQVANTDTNPAVTSDADRATRIPYHSTDYASGAAANFSGFAVVPAGYRLVVQQVSGFYTVSSGNPLPIVQISTLHEGVTSFPVDELATTYTGSAGGEAVFHQTVNVYVSAGDSPVLQLSGNTTGTSVGTAFVNGYLENCSVTGCP